MKTLGTGFTKGVSWRDIQVINKPTGEPIVELAGGAGRVAEQRGIHEILITISHCRTYATATAIALQHGPRKSG